MQLAVFRRIGTGDTSWQLNPEFCQMRLRRFLTNGHRSSLLRPLPRNSLTNFYHMIHPEMENIELPGFRPQVSESLYQYVIAEEKKRVGRQIKASPKATPKSGKERIATGAFFETDLGRSEIFQNALSTEACIISPQNYDFHYNPNK